MRIARIGLALRLRGAVLDYPGDAIPLCEPRSNMRPDEGAKARTYPWKENEAGMEVGATGRDAL
jgi:hypothetical protein